MSLVRLSLIVAMFAIVLDGSPLPHHPRDRTSGSGGTPQPPHASTDSQLVSAAQLRERLTHGDVVVLQVGERADYDAGHIPGARFFPYDAIARPRTDGVLLELPPIAVLDSLFESFGVSDRSRIVLYWSRDWYSATTRVFFTLDYLGLGDRTSVLDGGLAAWKAAGGEVTMAVPPTIRGKFAPHPRDDVVVDVETVRRAIADHRIAIIDARNEQFYTGQAQANHVRNGHIPGARNLPFNTVIDDHGGFKSRAALERLLDASGATPDKRVIAYCHIGQQASVVYFVARLLGRDVRLYDGSWEEWSRLQQLPIETGRP